MIWDVVGNCGPAAVLRNAALFGALVLAAILSPADSGAQGVPESGAEEDDGRAELDVGVFYVTNRRRHQNEAAADAYDGERGQPHFGRCNVIFTPIRFIDRLGRNVPFYVPRETNELSEAETIDVEAFWERLAADVKQTSSRSAVVFVHGYNYGFERTCRMAAEMQRPLDGKATVVMFSWPSNGNTADYVSDLADVEWSVPLLARFLALLGDRIGTDGVQVLAHSLGSRGTVAALERLAAERDIRPLIRRLVLLAPDFDTQTFVDRLPGLTPLAGSITLYASSNDTPLKLSRQLSGYPRLGEAGEYLTVVDGMETIDVSSAGIYQVFGHEYFFYHPLVAADLVALLSNGQSAAERSGLRSRDRDGIGYWEIVPEH